MQGKRIKRNRDGLLANFRYRRKWKRITSILSVFVIIGTLGSLMMPAITMNQASCGIVEHRHSAACYSVTVDKVLTCGYETPDIHTPDRYDAEGNLVCDQANLGVHTHNDRCFDEEGTLTCPLSEDTFHLHEDSCYQTNETRTLVCRIAEHAHTDACRDGGLTDAEQAQADAVIAAIDTLPAAEDAAARFTHFDETGDTQGREVYAAELSTLAAPVSAQYADLPETLRLSVTNREKLAELERLLNTAVELAMVEWEQRQVDDVVLMIQNLPSSADVEDQLAEYKKNEDSAGLAAYREKTLTQLQSVFDAYHALTDEQKASVTNASDLMELEYLLDILAGNIPEKFPDYTVQANGVSAMVELDDGVTLPEGTTFAMEAIGREHAAYEETYASAEIYLRGAEAELLDLLALDLHFADSAGAQIQPSGPVTVALQFEEPVLPGQGSISLLHLTPEGITPVPCAMVRDETGVHSVSFPTDSFSTYAIALAAGPTSIGVTAVNKYSASATHIFSSDTSTTIAGFNTGMSFTWWNACRVEYENNRYVVKEVVLSGTAKTGMTVSSTGFVLITQTSLDVNVGDIVTLSDNTFWRRTSAYNGQIYGTVTFDAPAVEPPIDPGVEKPAKDNTSKLHIVPSTSTSRFVTLNLYNYGTNINEKYQTSNHVYPGFQQEFGTPNLSASASLGSGSFNFGNNITEDLDANITSVSGVGTNITNEGGDINKTASSYTDKNGVQHDYGTVNIPIEGAIAPELGEDGYPKLLENGESLKYLFTDNTYATKMNTGNIDGLFQQNHQTGNYSFNSRENHAQFDGKDRFTLYKEKLTPNYMMYPFGNFLPFDDIVHNSQQSTLMTRDYLLTLADSAQYKYAEGQRSEYKKLADSLKAFVELMDRDQGGTNWSATAPVNKYFDLSNIPKDFTLEELTDFYTLDYDEPTNFYFGMEMRMKVMQPKDGLTGPNGDQKMHFLFTGDDDVWVYLGKKLILDLSGIHRHVGGAIDFENGVVLYFPLVKANGDVGLTWQAAYKIVNFEEIFDANMLEEKPGKIRNHDGSVVKTLTDYSTHDFRFYYMERGSGSSVCRLNFNFPLLRDNSISVGKALSTDSPEMLPYLGNPDFKFQIWKGGSTGTDPNDLFIKPGTEYAILNANNEEIGTGVTDSNGVFSIKAGQRASFEGIDENDGTYFVRELLSPDAFDQYGEITVDGRAVTTAPGNDTVLVGSDRFKGVDSPTRDVADGSTNFTFNNRITFTQLGKLAISKEVEAYSRTRAAEQFQFDVTFDGDPIPAGTDYTVGNEIRFVETEGVITLAAGETAIISDIIADSTFTVQETEASAAGYTVTYSGDGLTEGTNDSGRYVSGIIKTAATVQVRAVNSEQGTDVDIPIRKLLNGWNGESPYEFQFLLTETDPTGDPIPEGLTQQLAVSYGPDDPSNQRIATFNLPYLEKDVTSVPVDFYYQITETAGNADVFYDSAAYRVKVTVSRGADGALRAAVTAADGTPFTELSFTNTVATHELPETGGAGTFLYQFGGGTMIALACVLLYRTRRKQWKGDG